MLLQACIHRMYLLNTTFLQYCLSLMPLMVLSSANLFSVVQWQDARECVLSVWSVGLVWVFFVWLVLFICVWFVFLFVLSWVFCLCSICVLFCFPLTFTTISINSKEKFKETCFTPGAGRMKIDNPFFLRVWPAVPKDSFIYLYFYDIYIL